MNMSIERRDIWVGDEVGSTADRIALLEEGMDETVFGGQRCTKLG